MKKGDKVYKIKSWDDKGTFYIEELELKSMGKRQATAFSMSEGKMLEQMIYLRDYHTLYPTDLYSKQQAEAEALRLAANFIEEEKARLQSLVEKEGSEAYTAAMEKELAEMKSPSFIWL